MKNVNLSDAELTAYRVWQCHFCLGSAWNGEAAFSVSV